MLWKRVFRQEKGNTIFIPFSPTTLEHFLYFEKKAIKLFSLCSETQWLTGTNGMGNPTLGPGVQKNTTWQGSHIYTAAHYCSTWVRGTPLAYEILPVALTVLPGRKWGECSSGLLRGPHCPWPLVSLQLNYCSLSTEGRIFQECQGLTKWPALFSHDSFPSSTSHFLSHSLISI